MNERDEMYDINGGQLDHLREPQVRRQKEAIHNAEIKQIEVHTALF
jgi:hypothetical protein